MATFRCQVLRLTIEPHPNADRLELAGIGDYRSIVLKGQFKTGDLGVYIPEAALVPDWLLKEMGLEGKLSGKQHNRVKAVKLRGVLSQGLVMPVNQYSNSAPFGVGHQGYITRYGSGADEDTLFVSEGQDVTQFLGVEKYEPVVPSCMRGEVNNAHGMTLKYDIENLQRYPDAFEEGEEVLITEKIHGTWTCFGYHPDYCETYLVTSKGMSERGLAFKMNEANDNNLYIQALRATEDADGQNVIDRMRKLLVSMGESDMVAFYILGETYGPGVQKKFHYGLLKPAFRAFDIYIGEPGDGTYLSAPGFLNTTLEMGLERVPLLYMGPYSRDIVDKVTSGNTEVFEPIPSVSDQHQIREGCVIKPYAERTAEIESLKSSHPDRLILKSVSEAYLLGNKGGTEYN